MPYALRFNGNFAAEIATQIQLNGAGTGWRVEFDIQPEDISGAAHGFMSGIVNNGQTRFLKSSTDGFILGARGLSSGSVLSSTTNFAPSQSWPNSDLTVVAFSDETSGTGATVNSSGGTVSTAGRSFDLKFLGDGATVNLFRGLMYEVRVYQNNSLIHRYLNTTGTGNTWTDQVAGNNATLFGTVPTDDSQWVFYGEPSSDVDSTVATTWPLFSVAAEQSTVAAGVNSSIAAAWPLFNVSAAQQPAQSVTTGTVYFDAFVSGSVATPNNALGELDGTYTTNTGNTSWTARWSLTPLPAGLEFTETQTLTIRVRREASGGNDPSVTAVNLYSDGVLVGDILPVSVVAAWPSNDIVLTFNADGLGALDVELVTLAGGGGPSVRRAVQIDGAKLDYTAQTEQAPTVNSTVAATWPMLNVSAAQDSAVPVYGSTVAATWPLFSVTASQGAQIPAVNSAINAAWPLFSVTASQSAAAPVYVSTAAVTWPLFSVTASQGAQSPEVDSTIAAQWPMFATTANQVSVVPQYSSTAAITWPMFTAAASQQQELPAGATTVAVTWPMFSASGSQSATVPAFNASVAAQWPMFTANAEQVQSFAGTGASVAVTWPMFSTDGVQASTVPEYSLTASATWPMFSVDALAGEFEYFTAQDARIDLPALSRRVDLPALSRRVDIAGLSRRIDL